MSVMKTLIRLAERRALRSCLRAARCLHLVAELSVADALQEQPTAATELARRTGVDADALNCILRLLAAHGVFELSHQATCTRPRHVSFVPIIPSRSDRSLG